MKKKSKPAGIATANRGLSNGELHDVLAHMSERMGQALYDAMSLSEDPKQRAQMAVQTTHAIFRLAVEAVIEGFEADKGRRPDREAVISSVARTCIAFAIEPLKR
jgi:hypothetical protein